MRLRDVNDDWVSGHLQKKPGALKHIRHGKDVLLTGDADELRAFFAKHAGEAFTDGNVYKRGPTAH